MDFRKITIPYQGREAYPSKGGGESVKTLISNYLGGSSSIVGGGGSGSSGGGNENRGGNATSFFCFLSKTYGTYSVLDLAQGAITEVIQVTGYRGNEIAQTLVGDISKSAATATYDIQGISGTGISVSVSGNGTTGTTIRFTFNNTITGNSGTLEIPVAVNINDNQIDPYHTVWYDESNKCVQMNLQFAWAINRTATGSYVLDLSNQMAQVNCDADGVLYPASIATLHCTATTYFNGAIDTGVTYSVNTHDMGVTGFTIDSGTGVMNFVSGGTGKFYWNPNYPALPIDVIAMKDGAPIATKTMTISRNYPGSDGTPAHTRYIVTDYDVVKYDPNLDVFSPTRVIGKVMLQVGDQLPVYDSATTIYMWYNDLKQYPAQSAGTIQANISNTGITAITYALMNGDGEYYEIEEVPVIAEGTDGQEGEPSWYLSLSNDNASVNADADGTIPQGSVKPICEARLYRGTERVTNAFFIVDYGGATGVTSAVTDGILTLTFGNNLAFTGSSVSITVSGRSGNILRDVKVMTVTKSFAGTNGEDAVSYWLEPEYGEIIYDPNTSTPNPTSMSCAVKKQVGQGSIETATDAVIKYRLQNRSSGNWSAEATYTSSFSITSSICTTYRRLRFTAYVNSVQVDQEDIDILIDGVNGSSGASGESSWYLTLSNDNASINADAEGNILPGAVRPDCQAKLYRGSERITNATYAVNYGGATGVSTATTNGILYLTFGSNFDFTGTSVSITVSGYGGTQTAARDIKVMTITKSLAGEGGEDAVTYWLEVSDGDILYNPNTQSASTTSITATVKKQVGQGEVETASEATIYYNLQRRSNGSWIGLTRYTSALAISSATCVSYKKIRLYAYVDDVQRDLEDVDILMDGTNGASGTPGKSAWYLTLSNDNASINCDNDGNILPGAVKPTCQAKLYYGTERETTATYEINYGSATGVSSAVTNGILTLSFGSNFNFTGDVLSIAVSGFGGDYPEFRDAKIMNITKAYGGEDAVSYWLEPDYGEVIYNPNTQVPNPTAITCGKYKQIGQGAAEPASDATIKYKWQSRSTGSFGSESTYSSSISITSAICNTYSRLRFILYVGSSQVDQEDIDILVEGTNGLDGQGRAGAAVRGPYDWNTHSASTRCWCAGTSEGSCDECDKWIDVILKDGTYYYCNTTYYGSLSPWNNVKNYWTSGTSFDFVATNLLLASAASINFLTNNELYLRDSNGDITAGAAGGDGINFWAGSDSPGDAPFTVNNDGTMVAKKGTFGPFSIGTDTADESALVGTTSGGTSYSKDYYKMYMNPENIYFQGQTSGSSSNHIETISIAPNRDGDKYEGDAAMEVTFTNIVTSQTCDSGIASKAYEEDNAFATNGNMVAHRYLGRTRSHHTFTWGGQAVMSPVLGVEVTFMTTDSSLFTKNGTWRINGYDTTISTAEPQSLFTKNHYTNPSRDVWFFDGVNLNDYGVCIPYTSTYTFTSGGTQYWHFAGNNLNIASTSYANVGTRTSTSSFGTDADTGYWMLYNSGGGAINTGIANPDYITKRNNVIYIEL